MIKNEFLSLGEYAAAGLFEEENRNLFYRKALGLRRFYENCELAVYRREKLYPSGVITQKMKIVPNYMFGFDFNAKEHLCQAPHLIQKIEEDFLVYQSSVPLEHTVAGNMYTHSMPHYERILREGLSSYVPRIRCIQDADMREGLLHLVEGLQCYAQRCVAYLESVCAAKELIEALKRVPMQPARTIYEAIVAWNFILYLDNCDNLGCLAKGLLTYYQGEDIIPLLENLYDNLDQNGGYSMALDCECPELTVQCLKAAYGKRRPMIELFIDKDSPESVWQAALETVKSGGGQPAFYNANALLGGLKKRFPVIQDEDVSHFCGGGCAESMIAGLSNVGSLDAGINLLLILEDTMPSYLSTANSFDDFYTVYIDNVKNVVERVKTEINRSRQSRAKYNPLPMRTLLVDDCIERGKDYNCGGARYSWSVINFAGLINVIDSLLTIKSMVFEQKIHTADEMLSLLKKNDNTFLIRAIKNPLSFGKDNAQANQFTYKLSKDIFSMTETGELCFGEGFLSASIQFNSQIAAGKGIGATPDGRMANAPLCDSLAAIFGKDSYGPTALLNSVTSIDLKRALGVPVLNFNICDSYDENILKALILGYMSRGGIQMQITYASPEELLDAYEHPERHGNLIVRVGGYSEYFCRLSDELKKMVINRTIQGRATL